MGRPRKTKITLPGRPHTEVPEPEAPKPKFEGKVRVACDDYAFDYSKRKRDAIKDLVFGNVAVKSTVAKHLSRDGVRFVGQRITDTPLDYLMHRVEQARRLHPEQYEAAQRYLTLIGSCAATGQSNTAAVVSRMQMSVPPDADDRRYVADGGEFMACRDDSGPVTDPTDRIVSIGFALERIKSKLMTSNPIDAGLIDLFIVNELTIGVIASEWGKSVEYVSERVREALWTLARVMMEVDHEYEAWVTMYRTHMRGDG